MKTYTELTAEQRQTAINRALSDLLGEVVSGQLRWSDEVNGNDWQAQIDQALEEAEGMQTPWFSHEYVMDCSEVAEALRRMAEIHCEDALYTTSDDPAIIEGIA